MSLDKEALEYHSSGRPGKVDVRTHKPCDSEKALSLAYSPGVAAPCKEIAKDPDKAYEYTSKGDLVAVISNGTAVLGLGNIGPLASKPVMEGKGVLFKEFAGLNCFDIELDAKTPEEFISAVKAMEPTFGGINLEDIKAPECFIIEETLKKEMNIPIFHDDQHGTAIVCGSALINALKLTSRKIEDIQVVINGAGAAATAIAKLIINLGVKKEHLLMCDSKGVIYKGRSEGMNVYKEEFAANTERRSLADAVNGADVFLGVSVAGAMTEEMLATMAEKPIVFAMANPVPEILPDIAKKVRPDVIVATGRSDFPNQANNVLGFPYIFRGALDVRATTINEEMKMAAVYAIAQLAQEDVPESVSAAYEGKDFQFGSNYIIPKPFDPRVLSWVAPAVAKAAMDSGVAQKPIEDFQAYRDGLERLQSNRRGFIRDVIHRIKVQSAKSKTDVPRIAFPEGTSTKVLKSLNFLATDRICRPILVGNPIPIRKKIEELGLTSLGDVEIIDPLESENFDKYVSAHLERRKRRGVMIREAERQMTDSYYFASMMVDQGDADGLVCGAQQNYADSVRPILETIGTGRRKTASGLNIVLLKDKMLFFADTTINIDPSAEQLANIAGHVASVAEYFHIDPKVAMLSFTNFTANEATPKKMKKAADLVREKYKNITVDGEMQADTAVNPNITERIFPFSDVKGGANILLFPNLDAGNIAYKLVQQLGEAEVIGPFLLGIKKPANVVQRTGTVDDLVNLIVMTALEAQAYQQNMTAADSHPTQ